MKTWFACLMFIITFTKGVFDLQFDKRKMQIYLK